MQGRFLPQNYGYAGAIRTGKIMVENGRLVIKTPQLSLHAPLPFYTCDSASSFAARELTKRDIQAATIELNIPINPVEENGTIGHKVCLASEAGETYVIGLASPIDKFLGLFPYARMAQSSWLMNYFNGQAGNPFHRSPGAEIFEQPSWKLSGIAPLVRPLAAKNLADGRLAVAELGLGSISGLFYLALITRLMRFDDQSKSAIIEWNDNLYLKLPVNDLLWIKDKISGLKKHPLEVIEMLDRLQMVDFESRIPDASLRDQGRDFKSEAWQIVVEFLNKLPVAGIQAGLK